MRSESTRFFGQPKLTKAKVPLDTELMQLLQDKQSVYWNTQKAVNQTKRCRGTDRLPCTRLAAFPQRRSMETMEIDLNSDLGEGCGQDAELMRLVTSANICCGMHAGDYATSFRALALADREGV